MKNKSVSLGFLVALFVAGSCFAQSEGKPAESVAAKYFRLDFALKELEGGKVVNSRAYTTTISTDQASRPSSIRTGSRVPVLTKSGTNSESTYIDVGVNIDSSSAKELQNELALNVIADVSTTANDTTLANTPGLPIIRQTRWNANVLVPLRKATTIFSSDDATTKRQMQLEVTATPIP